jgi:hypothetical protein
MLEKVELLNLNLFFSLTSISFRIFGFDVPPGYGIDGGLLFRSNFYTV